MIGSDTYARPKYRTNADDTLTALPALVGYRPRPLEVPGRPPQASAEPAAKPQRPAAPAPSHQPEPPRNVGPDQVLAHLKRHGLQTAGQIAKALAITSHEAGQLLARLSRSAQVHRASNGRWASADKPAPLGVTRQQVLDACRGRARITARQLAGELKALPKTVANRLAELHTEGELIRIANGAYRDARWQPIQAPDMSTKVALLRSILRKSGIAMTSREIWEQDPQAFGGVDASRVSALANDQFLRGNLRRLGEGPGTRWYDPTVHTPAAEQQPAEIYGEAGVITGDGSGQALPPIDDDPILSGIERTAPAVSGLPPLPDHPIQCRRLRALADKDVLDPIIGGWLRELANAIETQHKAGDRHD